MNGDLKILLENNQIPLALAALYFLISSNYLGELFTCSLRRVLADSMINKHILAIITLYISVMLTTKIDSLYTRLLATAIVYVWFVITTKCTAKYVLSILFIIVLTYCIGQYIENNLEKDSEKKEYYEDMKHKLRKITLAICVLISIVGFISYYLEKKSEYGKTFKMNTFIFGVQNCSNN